MLHIQMGTPGQKSVIMASGSFPDIFSEVCTVVADLYKQMRASAPPMAAEFRRAFVAAVTDPDTPMWNGELKADFGMMGVMPVKQKGDKEGQ